MKKYVDFIFRNPKPLIAIFAILNVLAIIGIFHIKLNTDFSLFTTNNTIYDQRLQDLEETFGNLEQISILIQVDSFDNDVKTGVRSIQSELENVGDVAYVEGPTPSQIPILGVPTDIEDIDAQTLLSYFASFQEFSPVKTIDGTIYLSMTLILSDTFTRNDIQEIESILSNSPYDTYISGDIYNQYKIVDYILSILFILPPMAIIIILMVFRWQIGAIKPTLLSVFPAAIGSLWTFGIIGWLGNEVSILTAVIPVFIIVIGSADGLHFMTHFQSALREGLSRKEAMTKTLHVVGIPMIITTLTSMAGFLSLLSMDTSSVIDLAIFATIGIFLAGVATWYVLPLILSRGIQVLPKKEVPHTRNFTMSLKKIWGLPSLIMVVLFLAFFGIFFSGINNEFDMLSMYKGYTVVAKNATKIQEVSGGSIPLSIEITFADSPLTLDHKAEVEQLISDLQSSNDVDHVISLYRLMDILYANQIGGDIPSDTILSMVYAQASSSTNFPIDSMINLDEHKIRLLVFPNDMENSTLGNIEDVVNASSVDASITGVQYLLRDLNLSISRMQLYSILIAISSVFVMLAVSLRSFKLGIISLIPIVTTVAAIYGVMGLTGIPLNISTVIIFSITIGVGIDYAVHYSSVYQLYYRESQDSIESTNRAFKDVSKPILANALGVSLGLTALMFSPLTIHLYVSTLMWVGMIVSVILTLTVLPTIYLKLHHAKHG